jgi:hypothetical protein
MKMEDVQAPNFLLLPGSPGGTPMKEGVVQQKVAPPSDTQKRKEKERKRREREAQNFYCLRCWQLVNHPSAVGTTTPKP